MATLCVSRLAAHIFAIGQRRAAALGHAVAGQQGRVSAAVESMENVQMVDGHRAQADLAAGLAFPVRAVAEEEHLDAYPGPVDPWDVAVLGPGAVNGAAAASVLQQSAASSSALHAAAAWEP